MRRFRYLQGQMRKQMQVRAQVHNSVISHQCKLMDNFSEHPVFLLPSTDAEEDEVQGSGDNQEAENPKVRKQPAADETGKTEDAAEVR